MSALHGLFKVLEPSHFVVTDGITMAFASNATAGGEVWIREKSRASSFPITSNT